MEYIVVHYPSPPLSLRRFELLNAHNTTLANTNTRIKQEVKYINTFNKNT